MSVIQLLNDKGEPIIEDLEIIPFNTSKSISSAWKINLPDQLPKISISLTIKSINTRNFLFRDLFVHVDLNKGTFELPSAEIWVSQNNKLIDNLFEVFQTDIANIRELIEFEKGLRFAVLKLKELTIAKFEYLCNPYYLQNNQVEPMNDLADEIGRLTEELNIIDGQSHCALHEKMLKSFNNIKLRWEKVFESGTLKHFAIDAKRFTKEIADRHFGFVGNP